MHLLYVSQLAPNHDRDKIWVDEFERKDLQISLFSTYDYEKLHVSWIDRIRNRLHVGPNYQNMRSSLISLTRETKLDWIHFRMPIHFDPQTIRSLTGNNRVITSYYNDDPFSRKNPILLASLFIQTIPLYDHHFVFRRKNIDEFYSKGAKSVSHLPPFYPLDKLFRGTIDPSSFDNDAVFIGHWENDWRQSLLEDLARHRYRVEVRGSIWSEKINSRSPLKGPFTLAFGAEFASIYRRSHAGICFFSKMNNDSWTRRPLEIVASGGLLVCERTDEALSYFVEGKEAFFFSSSEELVNIVSFVKLNTQHALKVREQGRQRLLNSNYSISDRADEMLEMIEKLRDRGI